MPKRHRADFLASNLPQLQNYIKRDPISYKEEFLQQLQHFESSFEIFKLKPNSEAEEFGELVTFISHVSLLFEIIWSQLTPCYPVECKDFPGKLMEILSTHHSILTPSIRKTFVQALVLLRNRDLITSTRLAELING